MCRAHRRVRPQISRIGQRLRELGSRQYRAAAHRPRRRCALAPVHQGYQRAQRQMGRLSWWSRSSASAGARRRNFVWNQRPVCALPVQRSRLGFMRFPLAIILVALASTAHAQSREQKSVDWRTFEIPDFGTRIQYPAGTFSPAGKPETGVGQRFERADGRAVLSIYSRPNEAGDNPATYLRSNLRVSRSALDYARITRSFFAISSERHGVILSSRCNISGGTSGAIHCFDLKYPREEKRSWDAVVTRISLSLRPLES